MDLLDHNFKVLINILKVQNIGLQYFGGFNILITDDFTKVVGVKYRYELIRRKSNRIKIAA